MKNILLLSVITLLTSNTMMAQTVKDNIEKISRNPKTTENAAKADVKIHDKTITSSADIHSNKTLSNTGRNSKAGHKKKQYCKPTKK